MKNMPRLGLLWMW